MKFIRSLIIESQFLKKNVSRLFLIFLGTLAVNLCTLILGAHAKEIYPDYGSEKLNRDNRGIYLSEILKREEKILDSLYSKLISERPALNPTFDIAVTAVQLQKSQSAWLIYRNENCKYYGGTRGGDAYDISILMAECQIYETKKRIQYLKMTSN